MCEGCPVLLRVTLSPEQNQPPTLDIHAQRELLGLANLGQVTQCHIQLHLEARRGKAADKTLGRQTPLSLQLPFAP